MANSQIAQLQKEFIDIYGSQIITVEKAAAEIGRSRRTIYTWRSKNEEFDEKFKTAKGKQENLRLDAIEESVYQQIIEGKASAGLTIFVMKNLAPTKWKDSHRLEHTGEGGGPVETKTEITNLVEAIKSDPKLKDAYKSIKRATERD